MYHKTQANDADVYFIESQLEGLCGWKCLRANFFFLTIYTPIIDTNTERHLRFLSCHLSYTCSTITEKDIIRKSFLCKNYVWHVVQVALTAIDLLGNDVGTFV